MTCLFAASDYDQMLRGSKEGCVAHHAILCFVWNMMQVPVAIYLTWSGA
jgi:hypothetical protein